MTESSPVEPSAQTMARIAVVQAVADPVRWAVLEKLARETRCVCEIREQVTVPANLLSYHLKVLREAGLVTTERRGRRIDYSLAADAAERMREALPGGLVGARL